MSNIVEYPAIIRLSTKDDMAQICTLIKELAAFEKMEDQVKIDEKTLQKDGFDTESPAFKCLVAELNGQIVGYALYFICYSTWQGKSVFLEDLYVQNEHRRHGIGKQLFLATAKIAHETRGRMDFHVLSWNPASEFYMSLGAVNLTNIEKWNLFRLDSDSLKKLFC